MVFRFFLSKPKRSDECLQLVALADFAAVRGCKEPKNQHLRWVLCGEVFMIPDELFGAFAHNYETAPPNGETSRYYLTADGSARIFGGLNLLMFGDMLQIPPLPDSSAVFVPPRGN